MGVDMYPNGLNNVPTVTINGDAIMTTARFETKATPIATEFGENLARKWFGDDVVDALPRYVKGEKAGQIKGLLKWNKCVSGGWVARQGIPNTDANISAGGNVARPNEIRNKVIEIDFKVAYLIKCEPCREVYEEERALRVNIYDIDGQIESAKDQLEKAKLQLDSIQNETREEAIQFYKAVDAEKNISREIDRYTSILEQLELKKRYGGIIYKLGHS